MNATGVAFVGYPVTDVARARQFYEQIIGLKLSFAHEMPGDKWWVEYEIGGVALALSNHWPPSGQTGPGLALEVTDLDAALAELEGKGVTISAPPMSSPVCRFFSIKDPDGNDLTLHQTTATSA